MRLQKASAALLGILLATPATARDPFELDITVSGTAPAHFGFASIDEVVDRIDPQALRRDLGYNGDNSVGVDLDFRGLDTLLSFPLNGPLPTDDEAAGTLTFVLARADINRTFVGCGVGRPCAGSTLIDQRRSDALDQLKDFLKTNKAALKRLLTAFARFSPIDPLAGNPLSLMSQRMQGEFRNGFTHKVSQIWGCNTTAFNFGSDEPILLAQGPGAGPVSDLFEDAQERAAALRAENEWGIGALLQNTEADMAGGGFKSSQIALPLSYTWKFDWNPGHKLRFELPLSLTDTEGAESYSLGLGLAYTYPISEVWSLTPAIGAGATGSEDLVSAGGVASYSLTSAYTWRLGAWALSMGNSLGQYDSLDLKVGDVEAGADISNTVLSNGLLLSGPNALIAKNLVMEYSLMDTRISGDEVYSDSFDELGVAIGYVDTEMGVIDSYYKAGLSYLVGDHDITGLKLNLAMRF